MNRRWRDIILFVAGILGLVYETVVTGGERPTLIIAFLGMCGAPIFLRTDEAQTAKVLAAKSKKEKDLELEGSDD